MPNLRPYTAKARVAQVIKSYVKNGMNQMKMAKAEGISQPAVSKKLKNPEVQKALAKINEEALRRAGATLTKAYTRIAEGLDANLTATSMGMVYQSKHPDIPQRTKSAELVLELTGRKKTAHSEDITKPTEIHVHYGHRSKPRAGAVRPE